MQEIGNKIIQLNRVDSTNNYTAKLLKAGHLEHGTVILADEQMDGKGQRGASWQSKGGLNLIYTTFVVYDSLSVKRQESIHHFVALGIHRYLTSIGIRAVIKWPNDILVEDKKIAGILIENQLAKDVVKSSIIGIGLNVNQENFDSLNATSIRSLKKDVRRIKDVALGLSEMLEKEWKRLCAQQFTGLKKDYLSHFWKLNETVDFIANGEEKKGVIRGTDTSGFLQIEEEKGMVTYDLKEVAFLLERR